MFFISAPTTKSFAPQTKGKSCVLFVVARATCGPSLIRIEGTKDPAARLSTLAENNALEVFLAGMIETEDPSVATKQLHAQFANAHERGSWFRPTPELVTYIGTHAQTAINALLANTPPSWQPDEAVDVEQLAEILRVSPNTVRRMVQDGKIPYMRAGRRQLRFVPSDVLASLRET